MKLFNHSNTDINKYKVREILFITLYWILAIRLVLGLEFFLFDPGNFSSAEPRLFKHAMQNNLIASLIAGLIIGLITGGAELYVFRSYFKKKPFHTLIFIKMLVYLISISLIGVPTLIVYNMTTNGLDLNGSLENTLNIFESSNFYRLLLLGIYLSLILNFILIVKDKIGHGIFIPIIFGKYHTPKEEDRIFLFIDLISSTQMAEQLGHQKYSSMIQDCFSDLSNMIIKYGATVYQFVGDEAVVTWQANKKSNYLKSILLFKAYRTYLHQRSLFYIEKYGTTPEFKGAVNCGKVMVAEVGGKIKSEIAYHGDVLNTTARLLELCSISGCYLICSGDFFSKIKNKPETITIEYYNEVKLRGKNKNVDVHTISF